ncbi:MAG: hypothetical protein IPF99_32490 [Deltaproteobacteria bacterium]|nr:hypothetical protein [Deltaproteobacteria bacterium]
MTARGRPSGEEHINHGTPDGPASGHRRRRISARNSGGISLAASNCTASAGGIAAIAVPGGDASRAARRKAMKVSAESKQSRP